MKTYQVVLFLFAIIWGNKAFAQVKDTTLNVDILGVPVSPGFTILGVEPTSIEEPATPTDLLISIKNASKDFKNFPTDFSMSFAPGWVFGGSKIDYSSFASGKNIWQNIKQSALFSIATHTKENRDSSFSSQIGVGIKFSIFRGQVDETYDSLRHRRNIVYEELSKLNEEYRKKTEALIHQNEQWVILDSLEKQLLSSVINATGSDTLIKKQMVELLMSLRVARDLLENQIKSKYESGLTQSIEMLRYQASKIKFERTGFKLDLGMGLGLDFKDQQWNTGQLFKYGLWLNGGKVRQLKNGQIFTWLLTTRLLMSPDEQFEDEALIMEANNLRLDVGGRLVYKMRSKLSVSLEGIYRKVLNNSNISDTYRVAFNFDYQIYQNQALTLVLGRDFEGNFSKEGNLLAAVNFIIGIGKQRPF